MKRKVLTIMVFVLLSSLCGCHNSNSENFFGKYTFDKIIYISPASSARVDYLEEKLAGTKYIIKKDRFEIISSETQFKISNPIYKKEKMNDDLVQAFNDDVYNCVSISKYKEKYRYSIYDKDNIKIYYDLYSLDDELWIASYANDPKIKDILKLK